ncbi:MAG: hypothetical protein KGQ93_08030 [Cyanobacteria bacterium REEB459]|nr:hypothetical protein [Cyanobacteria bacterium REEB459]
MLNSLLAAFRQHYPNSSMASELLILHDGLYIVRVTLSTDGRVLVTGLAARDEVEAAEDQALRRALERLGWSLRAQPDASDHPPLEVSDPATPMLPTTSPVVAVDSVGQASPKPLAVSPPLPKSSVSLTPPSSGADQTPAVDASDLAAVNLSTIDLSDIIAQTDVELHRLGWGTSQGREFLERTYGKRSRHDLSDEELLEFLLYLESQPASADPTG